MTGIVLFDGREAREVDGGGLGKVVFFAYWARLLLEGVLDGVGDFSCVPCLVLFGVFMYCATFTSMRS